jgi:cell division inhibitor SepF
MAPSFMKKTMVYLGLLDDEYDEYDDLEDRAPRGFSAATRLDTRPVEYEQPDEYGGGMTRIRTIAREPVTHQAVRPPATATPSQPQSRPMSVRAVPVDTAIGAASARVHVVAPARFGDAKEIADRLKDNRPVIVNLQMADRDLQRRMIDFCSGVTYALSGEMEKVADQVFLLAPTNVKVSEEERQRLVERGFGRD